MIELMKLICKIDQDVEMVKVKLDVDVCMEVVVEVGKLRMGQFFEIY